MLNSSDLSARHWDVIVIGTGMGAATAGYALAIFFLHRARRVRPPSTSLATIAPCLIGGLALGAG